jgi:hypothetical protein
MSICSVDTTCVLLPSPLKMDDMPTRPMPTWRGLRAGAVGRVWEARARGPLATGTG